MFEFIRRRVPIIYHVCGDTNVVDSDGRDLLRLLGSTGADVLDLDFQVPLEEARRRLGPNLCLRGNTNTQVLGSAEYTPQEVVRAVAQTIGSGKIAGRYMFAAGCEWPWAPRDIAFRNLSLAKALVEKFGNC